ncbi:MAG TPA: hypothetical protein VHU88_00585 [Sporichthyaceae bacterium]|jgi:hypothetical protein|nr:hypothetical protein [Sporichthyaceae bacterium]
MSTLLRFDHAAAAAAWRLMAPAHRMTARYLLNTALRRSAGHRQPAA